ncbi:MAG TPA: histidine kinase dimerization/phosphoacceptor domain -containing protein, partial [Allosphingosinicella sp.]
DNATRRAEQTLARLDIKAQRINGLLARSASTIRAASAAVSLAPADSPVCANTLQRLARAQGTPGRFALYAAGNSLRCATPGYAPPANLPNPGRRHSTIQITPDGELLRFALYDDQGQLEGIGEFGRAGLAELTLLPGTTPDFDLELWQGEHRMMLRNGYTPGTLTRAVSSTVPVAGDRLKLRIMLAATPVSAAEMLTILLPLLMLIWAGIVSWMVLNRLLLRPLGRMERAVSAYQPGDAHLDLPKLTTPAREIGDLGAAFDRVTQTVARHEADLGAAVDRQTRLVREVHHRVKNNLQVVASLLNLHARGAANEEVAAAYASIQRRVDALAVVHRNHFAELEENRGVALRSLISELGANLRATAPASASNMQIRLAIEPYHVTQDVAVSVAFLVTEIVEYAMFCDARSVAVSVSGDSGATARLAIESDSLRGETRCDQNLTDRFERIVTGLSRQLRSSLEKDPETGRYALNIAVLDKSEV